MATKKKRAYQPADDAFRAEIADSRRRRHEAWLNREPGDGLAIADVLDPETHEVRHERVEPNFHAAPSGMTPLPMLPSKLVSRA